jgi:hypothetical protein
MGVNLIDTAPIYGTEAIVGKALKFIPRQSVVVATKASVGRNGEWRTPAQMLESLESSLRLLGTDHIDVFQLHGVPASAYSHARDTLLPALIEQRAKGKIRHIGLTELAAEDYQHEMLSRAARDDVWDVFMIACTLLMFAVRSIFAKPERVAVAMREAAARGQVERWLGQTAEPLAFLIHEGGASNITEAAYRLPSRAPSAIITSLRPPAPHADCRAAQSRLSRNRRRGHVSNMLGAPPGSSSWCGKCWDASHVLPRKADSANKRSKGSRTTRPAPKPRLRLGNWLVELEEE